MSSSEEVNRLPVGGSVSVENAASAGKLKFASTVTTGGEVYSSPSVVSGLSNDVSRVQKSSAKVFGLSPVSEIMIKIKDTSLDTPKGVRNGPTKVGKAMPTDFRTMLRIGDSSRDQKSGLPVQPPKAVAADERDGASGVRGGDSGSDAGGGGGGNCNDDGNANEDNDESSSNSRISTTFSLNSASRSPASRVAEQRQRSAQRRQHITPLRMDNKFLMSPGKENLAIEEDFSLYRDSSPPVSPRPCSPCGCPEEESELLPSEITPNKQIIPNTLLTGAGGSLIRHRRPLEDYDPNSMDSGYGASVSSESQKAFSLVTPLLLRQNSTSTASPAASSSVSMFDRLSSDSIESMDDEMDLFDMDALEDNDHLPLHLNSLISGDIKTIRTTPENKRPCYRRSLSLSENMVAYRAKNNLFESTVVPAAGVKLILAQQTPERFQVTADQENLNLTPFSSRPDATRCFKRPEPPGISPVQSKRLKPDITPLRPFNSTENATLSSPTSILTMPPKRPILQKSISMNDAQIMNALSRSSSEPDLIGDFSKSYILPLTEGRHRDLKSISVETMAALVHGSFNDQIASVKIIDCRYPYEFEGGHIRGAKNLYTQDQILEELIQSKTEPPKVDTDGPKRHIIVFHCEFSSERGPKLSRFLRNHDRCLNSDSYPALHYPEIYLLHGGYKDFFAMYPELCDPIAYRPMLDPEYGEAYRHFRAKSKSWNGDAVRGSASATLVGIGSSSSGTRLVKSRSRLVL